MRQTPDKMRAWLTLLRKKMNLRSLVVTLAAIVVFTTTYLLILPAFTLDKEEAVQQGGIDVVAEETAAMETESESVENSDSKDSEDGEIVNTDVKDEKSDEQVKDAKSDKDSKADGQKSSKSTGGALQAEGDGFTVSATPAGKSDVPDTAELQVEELKSTDKELKDYREEALEALKKDSDDVKGIKEIKVYDISLESDGKAVDTNAKFNVKIEYEDGVTVEDADNVRVLTFDDQKKAEVLDTKENKVETKVEETGKKSNVTEASFETEGISKVAVVEVETIEKTVITADGKTYKVTVKYDKNAQIPDGATLDVKELTGDEYDTYLEKTADKLDKSADDFGMAKFFDITIKNGNEEVKIANPVDVEIKLLDSELANDTRVLHFANENKADVVDSTVSGDTVKFEAEGFSIYAVVGEGETGENARMTIHFVNGEEIAQMIVKNGDTADELNYIIYDPGVGNLNAGELFKGWTLNENYTADDAKKAYDAETNPNGYMTIQDIREWALSQNITEHADETFYAMVFKTYSVAFLDEDGVTTHGEALIFKSNDRYTTYTIEQDYTPKHPEVSNFEGWYWHSPTSGAVTTEDGQPISENKPITVGTKVRISGNVTFTPEPADGHWLIFNSNAKNTSYTPPQFVKNGSVTVEPSNPTRNGYTFAGWYTDQACTQQFTFGNVLEGRTELYAKWEKVETAGYTVIIWKEKSRDTYANNAAEGKTREYDYWKSYNFVGTVDSVINAVSNSTTQTSDINGSYYDVQISGTKEDGSRINNDRVFELGYHAARYDTGVKIVPEGTSIVNVYYDRHVVRYTFYYPYDYTYTPTTSNYGTQYGLVDGSYVQVQQRNGYSGWWYDATPTSYYYTWTRYEGTRYTRSSSRSWQTYQESIGLYGEKLNWPTDTSIFWYPNGNNQGGTSGTRMTYKSDFIPLDSNMDVKYYGSGASGSGTLTFYTQDITGGDNYTKQNTIRVSAVGDPAGGGSTYGTVSFSINDKFTGFHAYQYRTRSSANGNWSSWQNVGTFNPSTGIYGDAISYGHDMEVRYNRISNTIAYMDGRYFDGNGVVQEEDNQGKFFETDEMFYETDLSSYNEGGADYYIPPEDKIPAGYAFGGWYADEACTLKYNFTTMPVSGVTVYAKWVKTQYRVFLHPNVPASDISYDIGGQSTSFRVNYKEKIADGNNIYATRNDYELVGWYLDEACTKIYSFDAYRLEDDATTASGDPLLSPYDRTEDTELDKYGNVESGKQGQNTDKDPNLDGNFNDERFWITKKVDLYAKWRSTIVGAPGIRVLYDAYQSDEVTGKISYISGQPRSYMDPLTYYLDRAEATAAAASTPDNNKLQFLYWVVQRWDESSQKYVDTEVKVYPGDTFEVLKADARVVNIENPSQEQIDAGITKTYTVQVRAQYGDREEHTPTHITWYPNFDTDQQPIANNDLRINEAVDIEGATTFTRDGYDFVGWAREPEYAATDTQHTTPITKYPDAEAWLQWDGTKFTVSDTGNTATQVAADERLPYHGMYAVWEPKPYTVTVKKVVEGSDEDKQQEFTFASSLSASDFNLKDTQTKVFENINYDSTFTVSETENANYTTTYSYKVGEDGEEVAFNAGANITVKGDMYVTVTNTRKEYSVDIAKTDKTGNALTGAVFEVLKSDGTGYRKYLDNDITVNGFANVKLTPGDYELVEKTAPNGFIIATNKYHFNVSTNGSITVTSTDTFDDGVIIVTKETAKTIGSVGTVSVKNEPGTPLPHTGGIGTTIFYILGSLLVIGCGIVLVSRKRMGSNK